MKFGAYALDSRGSILHFNRDVWDWGAGLHAMIDDVELQMLGMVEIRIVNGYGFFHYSAMTRDYSYLYQDWKAVLNERYKK